MNSPTIDLDGFRRGVAAALTDVPSAGPSCTSLGSSTGGFITDLQVGQVVDRTPLTEHISRLGSIV